MTALMQFGPCRPEVGRRTKARCRAVGRRRSRSDRGSMLDVERSMFSVHSICSVACLRRFRLWVTMTSYDPLCGKATYGTLKVN